MDRQHAIDPLQHSCM